MRNFFIILIILFFQFCSNSEITYNEKVMCYSYLYKLNETEIKRLENNPDVDAFPIIFGGLFFYQNCLNLKKSE